MARVTLLSNGEQVDIFEARRQMEVLINDVIEYMDIGKSKSVSRKKTGQVIAYLGLLGVLLTALQFIIKTPLPIFDRTPAKNIPGNKNKDTSNNIENKKHHIPKVQPKKDTLPKK